MEVKNNVKNPLPYKNINGSWFLLHNEITVQLFLPITRNSNFIQMTQNADKNSENLSPLGKIAVYVDKNELTFLLKPLMVVIVHLIHFASIDVLVAKLRFSTTL